MGAQTTNLCRQIRHAFFSELVNFLDQLIDILPNEAADLILYKRLVMNATTKSTQEWALDNFRTYVSDPFMDEISTRNTSFFTDNGHSLIDEHKGTQHGDDAMKWFVKLKDIWQKGEIDTDHEKFVWDFMQVFAKLADKEIKLRD